MTAAPVQATMEALSKAYSNKDLRVLMKQNNLLINDYDPKNGRRVGQPACVHAPAAACPCALSCGAPARWRGDREFHASALEPPKRENTNSRSSRRV